ncbi:cytochrome c oxidase subunit 3 family protein [Gordonia amarae]|uniref:Cytochrome aa3 subunit 3 n=2 Tax=Gordonia amarae TaxID=36821 RepID=G7GKC0_9ACTN|nr:cytochrome c oxidase subunit 3 [Gordonia amarae]MCS3880458.1 nitric oxide reductase NorE protein [Gordonia amarae]QHN18789.1 cytochrome c oxidase subunit 3 family protein [Gordonia amarae]QHN23264.1 cytochrome c oxidase subunit 3 family protein [Gordonia amarae]QHN32166.1 cytochrome c oxidase subunit 3 family protein [Gordonia amarae]QHN40912.1 cytochrome c oxidase subunit 3 family protein [Gordonia amarae]
MVSDTATEQGDRPPEQSEVPHTPGETGLWVFLLGDMVVFVVMFVAFLSERAVDADLFTSSRESVSLVIALTNTMVLLVSSLAVVIALNAVRAGRFSPAVRAFGVALLCAVAFIGFKATEYTHLVSDGHGPDSNAYFMWLFILTGVHLAHVVLGLGVLTALVLRARRRVPATGTGRIVYEGGACYWHLVDLLWMMLFPLVYLVA